MTLGGEKFSKISNVVEGNLDNFRLLYKEVF